MLIIKDEVKETYPTTRFGIMILRNITIHEPSAEFVMAKKQLEEAVQGRFSGMTKKQMRNLSPFSDYHAYYKKFKKTYHVLHQCESIASGKRNLPNGPPLVQAMFMAEIKNQLLTAGYDNSVFKSSFQVSLSRGETSFEGMGKKMQKPPENDIVFSSGQTILGSIICGPDHEHRIQSTTSDVVFAIYGVPGVTKRQMETHFTDIKDFVQLFSTEVEVDCMIIL